MDNKIFAFNLDNWRICFQYNGCKGFSNRIEDEKTLMFVGCGFVRMRPIDCRNSPAMIDEKIPESAKATHGEGWSQLWQI